MKQSFFAFTVTFLIFKSFSSAAIDPSSFIGQYRVGDCSQKGFTSVMIAQEKQGNSVGLQVSFFNNTYSSSSIKKVFVALNNFVSVYSTYTHIIVDNFTITNFIYLNTSSQGSLAKVVKLARSASGSRARLVESNGLGQKYFECVFYK